MAEGGGKRDNGEPVAPHKGRASNTVQVGRPADGTQVCAHLKGPVSNPLYRVGNVNVHERVAIIKEASGDFDKDVILWQGHVLKPVAEEEGGLLYGGYGIGNVNRLDAGVGKTLRFR